MRDALDTRRLDGPDWTLVLASAGGAMPEVAFWGPSLPVAEDLTTLVAAGRRSPSGGERDVVAPISVCPELARGFDGEPGLVTDRAHVPPFTGTFDAPDAERIIWRGDSDELAYVAEVAVDGTGTLTLDASITNTGATQRRLQWLTAPTVPVPAECDEIIDYTGRWCGEFRAIRHGFAPGAHERRSFEGRPGHAQFPGALFLSAKASHTGGSVLALQLAWSGGHRMLAQELADGRRLVQFSAMPGAGGWHLAPGGTVRAPRLYAARSFSGINGATAMMHATCRRLVHFADPERPRPVHYNCWEAVYFRHELHELKDLAGRAARLGAERFVLDDGWFRGRRDDRTGLGDWTVDATKYPDGLDPLIDHVEACGMEFGLWVEPEMVSPESELYTRHPEWILGPPDQPLGRHQYVLDLAKPEVSSHLFTCLDALLAAHRIGYLKWDHNRALPVADPAQTDALYMLLDRLRAAHPTVEIESCASGGARIDLGILARTQRVWLSDSNDALERLRIQHEALAFLPPEITGSHVGPRHCHTSGRVLSMAFRAWVAAQRAMGIELDPRELTDTEAAVLTDVVQWWKANRTWLHGGKVHRLDHGDPAVLAEMTVAADGSRFVVFAGQAGVSAGAPTPLRLTGLDPRRHCRVSLRAPDEPPAILNRGGHTLEAPVTLSGAALMAGVLRPPALFPETMLVLEGRAVDRSET